MLAGWPSTWLECWSDLPGTHVWGGVRWGVGCEGRGSQSARCGLASCYIAYFFETVIGNDCCLFGKICIKYSIERTVSWDKKNCLMIHNIIPLFFNGRWWFLNFLLILFILKISIQSCIHHLANPYIICRLLPNFQPFLCLISSLVTTFCSNYYSCWRLFCIATY